MENEPFIRVESERIEFNRESDISAETLKNKRRKIFSVKNLLIILMKDIITFANLIN